MRIRRNLLRLLVNVTFSFIQINKILTYMKKIIDNPLDDLERLHKLKESGAITTDEFEQEKKKILL